MESLFNNYPLEREELLARIAQGLQLDQTRLARMDSAYRAIAELIEKDEQFFKKYRVEVYAQGSRRISTTVKPLQGSEFDLDIVLQVFQSYSSFSAQRIFDELCRVLESNDTYKKKMIKKNRCIRIDYEGDFHIDILPASLAQEYQEEVIVFYDHDKNSYFKGNPKGYANWFLDKARSLASSMLQRFHHAMIESKVDTEPLPEELYTKTPLQRGVQLSKHFRDRYYENKDYPVSSIVITTLFGQFYNGEDSIYETIDKVLDRIIKSHRQSVQSDRRFQIANPVIPEEKFTDSWTDQHYESFFSFIDDYYEFWQKLKQDFEYSSPYYKKLFGETAYRQSLRGQHMAFGHLANDEMTKALGLILTGKAHSDEHGKINKHRGEKHEKHSNFGG